MSAWDPATAATGLAGVWTLERVFDNGAAMTGRASFAADADGRLDYAESGQLRLASGVSFDASQRYLFMPRPSGFSVMFAAAPQRLFHDVVLRAADGALAGDAIHACGSDLYRSRYTFLPDGSFTVRHAVDGPRKRYVVLTRYRRP